MEEKLELCKAKHDARIHSLAFDKTGRYLQSSSGNGTVKIMDVEQRILACPTLLHEGAIRSSRFSSDGSYLLTSGSQSTIWDWKKGRKESQVKAFSRINSVFDANDRFVVADSKNGISIFDTQDPIKKVHSFEHRDSVWCDFHPELPLMASIGSNRQASNPCATIKFWDTKYGRVGLPTKKICGRPIQCVFTTDGSSLAACSSSGLIWIWDLTIDSHSSDVLGDLASLTSSKKGISSSQNLDGEDEIDLFTRLKTAGVVEFFSTTESDINCWEMLKDVHHSIE